jgi:two-component system response regulator DegU
VKNTIKIIVADDHTLFRKAFVKLLREFQSIKAIREASHGKELLELVKKEIPDVVILDLEMPEMDGIKACRRLVSGYPEVKIIVLSIHDSKAYINHMLQVGAHAFLSKKVEPEELEKAIDSVIDKGVYRNEMMNAAIRQQESFRGRPARFPNEKVALSEREQTVVLLVCKQFTNRQIASELSLSENTIRNHKVRIMRKTGTKNTAGLVHFAFENGLIIGLGNWLSTLLLIPSFAFVAVRTLIP